MHYLAERIKQLVSMREAVEHYGLELNRAGFCVCPFHAEKTASMKIYPTSFYCFGCGVGGDVISFVQNLYDLDFRAAVLRIGYDFGLSLLSSPGAEESERVRRARSERAERKRAEERLNRKRKKYLEMRCELWLKQKSKPLTENERIKLEVLDDWLDKNP